MLMLIQGRFIKVVMKLKDFSHWTMLDIPITGLTKKVWLTDGINEEDGVRKGIFKYGYEWTEPMAKGIANIFQIESMECEYGTYNGSYGTMCYYIGDIFEVGDILDTIDDPGIDITYTLEKLSSELDSNSFLSILKMLIFDYIIGNRDRHSGNFALWYDRSVAPLYDNASSLCHGLSIKKAEELRVDVSELLKYSFDIMSQIKIPHRCTNFELMYYIKENYSLEWHQIIDNFLSVDMNLLKEPIYQFEGIVHSDILYCIFYGVQTRFDYLRSV